MYRSDTSIRLSRGMSTPAIRAIARSARRQWAIGKGQWGGVATRLPIAACPLPLSLPLLVPRVLADDPDHAVAADHLALLAARFNRRLNFHDTPAISYQPSAISDTHRHGDTGHNPAAPLAAES